ncbi:MAG: hypothetical protein AAF614_30860 [Chloroflexota bacterium]
MSDREGNLFGLILIAVALGILAIGWLLFQQQVISGIEAGLIVGLLVGSIIWPIVRTPGLGGRALIGGFIGVLLILLWEALSLGNVFRGSNFFTLGGASLLTGTVVAVFIRILQAAYVGAAFSLLLVAPAHLIIGAMIGAFVASAAGGIGIPVLATQGITLPQELLWLAIGLITLAVFIIFDSA